MRLGEGKNGITDSGARSIVKSLIEPHWGLRKYEITAGKHMPRSGLAGEHSERT